jgi:multidrug efflux pump subunit AcrA (membrane-fusion protein)
MITRKTLTISAVLLVLAAAVGAWLFVSSKVTASSEEKDLLVIQKMDYPVLVTATGIVEAEKSVSIHPPRIMNERRFKLVRMVDEGTKVAVGDFLMQFDDTDVNNRLRTETANFQSAQEGYQKKRSDSDVQQRSLKLQLEQAKADLDKLENKLSRQEEVESALTIAETKINRDTAKIKVQILEKKLKSLDESSRIDADISRTNEKNYRNRMDALLDALDALNVYSPAAGVVIYKRDFNNEAVKIGSNVFLTQTIMELPDLSTLRAKVQIDEEDAGKMALGQEARIFVDAAGGRSFDGKMVGLSAILKQASIDRPQKIQEAYISLSGEDLNLLRPGMSTQAQVQVGRHSDVIVIPLTSIYERDGRSFVQVWLPDKKNYELREVQLLTSDGTSGVISSGLQVNEKIRSKPKV